MAKRNPADDIVTQRQWPRPTAHAAVDALLQAGWRLVRTDDCANPDAPIGQCGCVETRITQEWTASDQLREMRGE